VGTLFLLVFFAGGVFFSYLLGAEFLKSIAERSWPRVDCTIVHSGIVDNHVPTDPKYRFDASYAYAFDSRQYTGSAVRQGYQETREYYDAQKLADEYPVGAHAACYVDPKQPQNAVLRQASLWTGAFLFLPACFW